MYEIVLKYLYSVNNLTPFSIENKNNTIFL